MTRDTVCPADHTHGATSTCYLNHKCGCKGCLTARTEYQYWARGLRRAGRTDVFDSIVDGRGVRRRIQALMALGYSAHRIGQRLDVTADAVLNWLDVDRVRKSTLARIDAVYEQLAGRIPPMDTPGNRASAHRTRNLAARRGYLPPLAWDDIDEDESAPQPEESDEIDVVAVELAITDGAHVNLTRTERRAAVQELNAVRRLPDTVIAQMLRVNEKTIARDRDALGLAPAVGHDYRMPLPRGIAA